MIEKVIDYLGFHGPNILFLTSCFSLLQKKTCLINYVVGYIINIAINYVLKNEIKEERPSSQFHYFHLDGTERHISAQELGAHEYGMPSGHSQAIWFTIVFTWFAFHNCWITLFYTLIAVNTMVQRIKYKNHTWQQVLAGSIMGSIIGYAAYVYQK